MPLIGTSVKGAAALILAAVMVPAPAEAAPGVIEQTLVKNPAGVGAFVVDGVIKSIVMSFPGAKSDGLLSRQAERDDDRGDRSSRRGRSEESRARSSREPPRDEHDAGRRAGDRGEQERRMADRRSSERGGGDHRSDRHDRSDHRSDHHDGASDHRSDHHDDGDRRSDHHDRGDHYADRRDHHHDGRGSHRRHYYDDHYYGGGRGGHYSGGSYGGYQSYGYSHDHGPHRGHGYYCNTHFTFHYFAGYDPVGWYFAFHDGYSPPYGCRTVERIDYRHGRRMVYGAVQCYDDWGYPYIVRGSQYVYRTY